MLENEVRELERLRREHNRGEYINEAIRAFLIEEKYSNPNKLTYALNIDGLRGILKKYTIFLLDRNVLQIKEDHFPYP